MSRVIVGAFLDPDDIRHRIYGLMETDRNKPPVNWDYSSHCLQARVTDGRALSSANRPITCVMCLGLEEP